MLFYHISAHTGSILGTIDTATGPSKVRSLIGFNTRLRYTARSGISHDMDCAGYRIEGNQLFVLYGDTQPVIYTVKPIKMTPTNKYCVKHFTPEAGCVTCITSDESKIDVKSNLKLLTDDEYSGAYKKGCGCQSSGKFKDGCVNCFSAAQYELAKLLREKAKRKEDIKKPLLIALNPDCDYCMGYGMWPDDGVPMSQAEAVEGYDSEPCPHCHSSNMASEDISVAIEEDKTPPRTLFATTLFSAIGDGLCVESSDMLEAKTL